MSNVPDWVVAQFYCRNQMDRWIADSMERNRVIPWLGITDETTFMMSWTPHYLLTGRPEHLEFMRIMRDRWWEWAQKNLYHGYFPEMAEEHHHTEDFKRFLGRLWLIDPWDKRNVSLLDDFAEHLGNWREDVPPWYDWKKHRFVSRFLGTRRVSELPEHNFNSVGFCRYLIILNLAYLATGKGRYLELARDYADAWLRFYELHLQDDPPPTYVGPNWEPQGQERFEVRDFGNGGMLMAFLDLHAITGEEQYAQFVRRALDRVLSITSSRSGRLGWTIWTSWLAQYRAQTGDRFIDDTVMESAGDLTASFEEHQAFTIAPKGCEWRAVGEDGALKPVSGVNPQALAFAFQISGDPAFAAAAMRAAGRAVEMIRPYAEDGRTHGCGSPSTTSTVNSTAFLTLYPLTMGMYTLASRGAGVHRPAVTFAKCNGEFGLPDEVAALYLPDGGGVVKLFNAASEPVVIGVNRHPRRPRPMGARSHRTLWRTFYIAIELPPGREIVLHLPEGEELVRDP